MPYTQPELRDLRASVYRDLRDEEQKTWSPAQVDDLINGGIDELNRVRPIEGLLNIDPVVGATGYPVPFSTVFRVERYRAGGPTLVWSPIPEASGNVGTQDGWELFGGAVIVPSTITPLDPEIDEIRVWGYQTRDPLTTDDDIAEFVDHDDELAVRAYARYTGAEMLLHDRLLFSQWQTQTNNTDVSPTQLLQTVGTFQQQWETTRNRLRRLRRAG